MNAPTVTWPSKRCQRVGCGKSFRRYRGQPDQSWDVKIYCGDACSRKAQVSNKARKNALTTEMLNLWRTAITRGGAWQPRAACRDVDPELFFPVGVGAEAYRQVQKAKQVCAGCPVVNECAAWAVDWQPHGVAGGLDEFERADIRLRRRAAGGAR